MLEFYYEKGILATVIIISILFVCLILYIFSRKPASTSTSTPKVTPATSTGNQYQGDYFSFKYPDNFTIKKINTTDGRVLENWQLTQKESSTPTSITITLFASTKDLTDFEPVQSRRSDTSQYLEEIGRMKDRRGVLFRTIDEKERTVYFTNKHQILTVDYIAQDTDPSHETEYQSFLEGINWE